MGGFAVTDEALKDGRIKTVIALSDADIYAIKNLKIPVMVITGDFDLIINDNLVAIPGYNAANPPKELVVIKFGTHNGFTNLIWPMPPWNHNVTLYYLSSWLDCFLREDKESCKTLEKPHRYLSTLSESKCNLDGKEKVIKRATGRRKTFTAFLLIFLFLAVLILYLRSKEG